MAFGTQHANDLANLTCRGTAPAARSTPILVGLATADPGVNAANEVSGGSYARQSAGYAAASGGACALAGTLTFVDSPAVTVTHVFLIDSAGLFIQGAALSTPKILNAGDTLNLTAATNSFASS